MRSRSDRNLSVLVLMGFLIVATLPRSSEARVVAFVVEQRRLFASGMSWGTAGPYERLDGTAYMEVDPRDPLNAVIVNLDKAPKNARGMVEFSSPFFILKPLDMTRGNHKLFYGINNRGNKIELSLRQFPTNPNANNNDPLTAADVSDGFLLRLGYVIVDAGWQGDVAPGNNRLFPTLPVARQPDGSPIINALRIEYSDRTIPDAGTFTQTLEGNPAFRSYETSDTNTAHSTLTVRIEVDGARTPIPSDRWAFGKCAGGPATLVPTTTDICLFDGFDHEKLYELIYPAKNPIVMGLGYAVTRDIGSFLRYQAQDVAGDRNPIALGPGNVGIRRAYSSGTSSTAMYQRDFLYLGFNEDETHRKVFDAAIVYHGGAHRLGANVEFADPNIYARQDDRHDFLSYSQPPLTFAVATDPVSGLHDGFLKRPATDPLVFQIDGEGEFWQWQDELNVVDGFGQRVPIPDNVRMYLNTGYSHINVAGLLSPPQSPGICQNLRQTSLNTGLSLRALTVVLDAWADHGIEPPRSNYPTLEHKTAVTLEEYRAAFPAIPGAAVPTVVSELNVLNFGPLFGPAGGILTVLPPLVGPRYPVILVPRPDMDGIGIAGIRQLQIRVPLGTNVGWNVRAPGHRAPNLCGPTTTPGSYMPFARTKAERLTNGDPRKSLEERYEDHEGFVDAVKKAAKELVHERFLLEEDANAFIQAAEVSDVLR
jgi:Alpha/beta hydrolase domain